MAALLLSSCGPSYPKCETDEHCEEQGEVCVDGTCQQCRDDTQCGEGQRCAGGRCEPKPECESDTDCDGKVCRSGKCQLECTGDADCGSGLKCKSNRCVDALACESTSDCGPGMNCVAGRCQTTDVNSDRCLNLPTVYFAFNESTLTPESRDALQEVADCLKVGTKPLTIEGHADERGTVEFNLALGDRRARSVEKFLSTMGIETKRVRIISKGELEPADPSHNDSAWSKNRRAEFLR